MRRTSSFATTRHHSSRKAPLQHFCRVCRVDKYIYTYEIRERQDGILWVIMTLLFKLFIIILTLQTTVSVGLFCGLNCSGGGENGKHISTGIPSEIPRSSTAAVCALLMIYYRYINKSMILFWWWENIIKAKTCLILETISKILKLLFKVL